MDDAITELKASAVADVVANVGAASTSKISDRLLHITRPQQHAGSLDHTTFVVDWASPAVQQKFLAKRGQVNFIRACAMLWEANHVKSAAGLGYLAENIVHQYIISHSFTLTGQRLAEEAGWPEPVESKIFAFQPTTKHWFASMQELTQLVSSRSDARLCSLYLKQLPRPGQQLLRNRAR